MLAIGTFSDVSFSANVRFALSKRRQADQFSSRSPSSRGIQLKPGYQRCGPPVADTSSQLEFMLVLTFQPANMPDWWSAGLKASV
jgi:hypothetical protein